MCDSILKLKNPPIIEAILDIDCDLPPGQDFAALEAPARDCFMSHYPKPQRQYFQHFHFDLQANQQLAGAQQAGIQAFRFLADEEKQIVQVRQQGFSFNRLSPYNGLDEYMPEMERTWKTYVDLANPIMIREIRLRFINCILVPLTEGKVDLDQFLKIGPRLPVEERLQFGGFLNQYTATDKETGHIVSIILTTQPVVQFELPIILDITVSQRESIPISRWEDIQTRINSLRTLKNLVFRNTLTELCLQRYQ